jgi:hypothetical protein
MNRKTSTPVLPNRTQAMTPLTAKIATRPTKTGLGMKALRGVRVETGSYVTSLRR